MDEKTPLGPNMRRLIAYKVADYAIPPGGGFEAGIQVLLSPEKLRYCTREAFQWAKNAVAVIQSAKGSPYVGDDEGAAGSLLAELKKAGLNVGG